MNHHSDVVFPPAARRAQAERGSARAYDNALPPAFPIRVTLSSHPSIAALE